MLADVGLWGASANYARPTDGVNAFLMSQVNLMSVFDRVGSDRVDRSNSLRLNATTWQHVIRRAVVVVACDVDRVIGESEEVRSIE